MVPAGEGPGHEELLGALAEGEVLAHFQPIVELDGGRVVAAEALARWHHPRHGMLGPASFVPVAKAAGVAAAIDREMLAQSCAAAAAGASRSCTSTSRRSTERWCARRSRTAGWNPRGS